MKRNFVQRELGFFGGGSYYIGDLNPRRHFLANHPAGGIYFRYMNNYRFAFRFGFNYGTVSGDDAASTEADQLERNLNFTSKVYELHSLAEFNFVEYRIGHNRYRFTMFIFGGLGGNYTDPRSNTGNGYESVRELRTEGQGKSYPKYQLVVPFGIGIKWSIAKNCGLGLEWGPRRTFTDYLDDVSGVYPDVTPDAGVVNPKAIPGSMRGNPTTRDWYFFYGVTLTFKLRESNRPCHSGG
jgi:hypothetical protein